MPFGIEGQYKLDLNINGNNQFLEQDDFEELTVVEKCGNVLPTFELKFKTRDESILARLNQGQFIQAQLGKDNFNEDIELRATELGTFKEGEDQRYFAIKGLASKVDYITNHNYLLSDKKSAIEVATEVLQNNFKCLIKCFIGFFLRWMNRIFIFL